MTLDKDLVPLLPATFRAFPCPACGKEEPRATGTVWPGSHVLGVYECTSCSTSFLRDLPVGFAVDHAQAFRANAEPVGSTSAPSWLSAPLLKAAKAPNAQHVPVERKVLRHCDRVVVLNTLDFLYGHVLLKLYNATHYLDAYPQLGLVVIVPRMFAWLVPKGVAEVWIVDLRLGQMQGWYTSLDSTIQDFLKDYAQVDLARGYAHPDMSTTDLGRFTGERPFPLEEFTTRPPHFTFVAREDRLWFRNPMAKFLYSALNKLGLRSTLGRYFVQAQDRLIRRTIHRVRERLPGATFSVVGLGRKGRLGSGVRDLRSLRMDEALERDWCAAYARSHAVVGVHGSNMLLPTALAAACVEILPYDRFGNIVQDITVRTADRMQLFLYRFVDEFASPAMVARHIGSLCQDFPHYYRNTRINVFR
jgi:hypothetical protein